MARTAAKARPKAARPGRKPKSFVWLQGLLCGGAIAAFPATGLLCLGLIGPAIATLWLDTAPSKPIARATILIAAATLAAPLHRLWSSADGVDQAMALLGNPSILALSWASTGAGWLLAEIAALLTQAIRTTGVRRRHTAMQAEHATLTQEWKAP